MSSRQYAPLLRFSIRPSNLLKSFIIAVHSMTFLLLWLLPVSHFVILLSLPVFAFTAYRNLEQHGLLESKPRIQEIIHTSEGDWKLAWSNGTEIYAGLQADSYLHPFITILNFTADNRKKYPVVLLPDSVDPESFRRVRVLLFCS